MQRYALNDYITVIDEFLGEPQYTRLRRAVLELPIGPPGDAEPGFVQRPGDTPPEVSDHVYRSAAPTSDSVFGPLAEQLDGCAIDDDLHIVEFSIRLQVAARGASLGAHTDGEDARSGGFTFYLCDWDPHWGGMLLCFDPAHAESGRGGAALGTAERGLKLSEGVANIAIAPRSNRLVLLRNPIWHLVTPVLPEAGDRRRLACAGYYRSAPRAAATRSG